MTTIDKSQIKRFARVESLCVFKFSLMSLIKSISWIRQSNLFLHLLRTLKRCSIGVDLSMPCCVTKCLPMTTFYFIWKNFSNNEEN